MAERPTAEKTYKANSRQATIDTLRQTRNNPRSYPTTRTADTNTHRYTSYTYTDKARQIKTLHYERKNCDRSWSSIARK